MRFALALFLGLLGGGVVSAAVDDSYVIEHFSKELTFQDDGSWSAEQAATVRVDSDAAVRRFGTLSFSYDAGSQSVEVLYVRVRKASGEVVETPASDAHDVAAEVNPEAPAYSERREKQAAVRGLQRGDVLEYRVRFVQRTGEAAGEFWYSHRFLQDQTVRDERLTIRVPEHKYVQVVSRGQQPEVTAGNGQRIYRWVKTQAAAGSVELTTFRNWQELGAWYAQALLPQAQVSRAVQAKAEELTRDLTTDDARQRAIYQYVSTRFRYVAVALGEGKYRPHAAGEVLANQYGDCKDKHTLLAALLKAKGITAWPALVGSEASFDETVPSPSHFDHVITVVMQGTERTWLDTTPEIAPYALLQPELRNANALLLSDGGAQLVTTPAEPPFAGRQEVESEATLSNDGTLTAHMQLTVRGDDELTVRGVFHRASPDKWAQLVQGLAANMGLDGVVSGVKVDAPEILEQPFHLAFDYERKQYSDWAHLRIAQPLLPFVFPVDQNDARPVGLVRIGFAGEMVHRCRLHLPARYSAELPESRQVDVAFAAYSASYAQTGDVLTAERRVVIRQPKIGAAQWEQYVSFLQQVQAGEAEYSSLARTGAKQAESLLTSASEAIGRGDVNSAEEQLAEAARLDPEQAHLWSTYAALYAAEGDFQEAVTAQRREVASRPDSVVAQLGLAEMLLRAGEKKEGVALLARVCGDTDNPDVLNNAAYLLADKKVQPEQAVTYARRALQLLQTRMAGITLDNLTDENLRDVESLASVWDTLGWSLFQAGQVQAGKSYLQAAWNLGQHRAVAEHLRQVQPETADAMQFTRVALTKLRTVEMKQATDSGTAEFFLLFAKNKATEARFIDGSGCLREAGRGMLGEAFPAMSPDGGPEKIVRRARMTCAAGACRVTLLLPAAATK